MALNERSLRNLKGVHPDLVNCVELANEICAYNFIVVEGVRTLETQKKYVATGRSQTLNSRHLPQKDGYSHAVDLAVVLEDGSVTWDLEYYYHVADAMDKAADSLDIVLTWGAAWNTTTENFDDARKAVNDYIKQRKSLGRKVFIDAVHFQIEV